ncbi:MAG: AMP-binding protein, partial [Myxococcales bacterium]
MASLPTSFADYWDRHARHRGERTAVADRRRSLSWREASESSRAIARGLAVLGIERGAVVACWLPNWVESYVVRIACERAGLIWLPIAARLREWELQKILERSNPAALIVPDRFHDRDYLAEAQALIAQLRNPPRVVVAGGAPAAPGSLEDVARLGNGAAARSLPEIAPDEALVILPTSGSTGIPKFAQFRVST